MDRWERFGYEILAMESWVPATETEDLLMALGIVSSCIRANLAGIEKSYILTLVQQAAEADQIIITFDNTESN